MNNPFETIDSRLSNIENLLLDIKHHPQKEKEQLEQPDQFLTIVQAAELLNLKVPTIYSKCQRREIPYSKRGGPLYFSQKELNQYLQEGKRKSQDELNAEAEAYLTNKKKG